MTYPPGPRGLETLGFFGRGSATGALGFLEKTARQYGPVSSFRVLRQRIFVLNDADLIRDVLVARQHDFERDLGARFLRELVGDSIITRMEPQHRERRRVLQPAFHREQIESYADSMISLSTRAVADWAVRPEIVVNSEMRKLTLAIVGASLFGVDFTSAAGQIAAVLYRVFRKARKVMPLMGPLRPVMVSYRKLFPRGPSLFFESERRELDRIVMPLIEERRRASAKDMVSLLIAMELSDRDARDEIVTFVLAGHETTATALTWASYLLARHPEVSARIEAEVDEVLEDRRMTFDDVARLRYTAMVFNETLRLYPPAPLFGRRAIRNVDFGAFTVPKGASVMLSPWITQRDPRYWERPEAFEPERWESSTAPKFAFFPFGGGAKMCIGDAFAKLEGVIVLAEMARRFRFALAEPPDIGISPGVTLQPDRPIRLLLEPRPVRASQPS
jgi:cytochrome P450